MKKIIFFIVLFLFGCEKLRYGNVISKTNTKSWSETMLLPMSISYGKTMTTVLMPYFIYHNESWAIDIKGIGTKGDTIIKTFYVDKNRYDTISVGNFICVDGLCDKDTSRHEIPK